MGRGVQHPHQEGEPHESLRQRIAREESFTLIELLVVMIIIGILLAIAIPSYLGFRDRAHQTTAKANLREAIPDAEAFFASNDTYVGMTETILHDDYDNGLKTDRVKVAGTAPSANAYCLESKDPPATTDAKFTFHYAGPGGDITQGGC